MKTIGTMFTLNVTFIFVKVTNHEHIRDNKLPKGMGATHPYRVKSMSKDKYVMYDYADFPTRKQLLKDFPGTTVFEIHDYSGTVDQEYETCIWMHGDSRRALKYLGKTDIETALKKGCVYQTTQEPGIWSFIQWSLEDKSCRTEYMDHSRGDRMFPKVLSEWFLHHSAESCVSQEDSNHMRFMMLGHYCITD